MLGSWPPNIVKLDAPHFPVHWFQEVAGGWAISFFRYGDSDDLYWGVSWPNSEEMPRGYEASVKERGGLWAEVKKQAGVELIQENGQVIIILPAIEGEPIQSYLKRSGLLPEAALYSLLLDVIRSLSQLIATPRLLSSIAWEDVLIARYAGIKLKAKICPVYSMLREEMPRSDFELARYWTGVIASIVAASGDCWAKDFSEYDPLGQKEFRSLLKRMDKGREISLSECFAELEGILLSKRGATRIPERQYRLVWGECDFPQGALAVCLKESFRETFPDKVSTSAEVDGRKEFSSFVVNSVGDDGKHSASSSFLLPPEEWFERSLIDPVNRRLSVPFLKAHPNLSRIRSLFCESGFTALVGDSGGIPLVALLEAHGGIEPSDALRIGEKLSRALSQFESANFTAQIHSPWQIEIHAVEPKHEEEFMEGWLSNSIRDWPAWDVKLRPERPAESFLPHSDSQIVWKEVVKRLHGKEFPALQVWMLEWERLHWAARQGSLATEPLSWDCELAALFEATAKHFEVGKQSHRARFLELVGEGFRDR